MCLRVFSRGNNCVIKRFLSKKREQKEKKEQGGKKKRPVSGQSHPSHSQTSRLLTSSLCLGVPVPRTTQCFRDV